MASSILSSALPNSEVGRQANLELIASSDEDYEDKAVYLGENMQYESGGTGQARGRLIELRKMLFLHRWESKLFDTRRWVRDLEEAYENVWKRWVKGEEGDIWL
jgi:predicted O-linked N-acetylglucosamine transferase (SPINDLY family)